MHPLSSELAADLAQIAVGIPTVKNPRLGTDLTLDVSIPEDTPAARARGSWEGALFVGAVAARIAATPDRPRFSEVGITLVTPDGTRTPIGGGIGTVEPDQWFDEVTAETEAAIVARAAALGFTETHVEKLTGIQSAVAITTTADDPALAVTKLRQEGGVLKAFVGEARYEGVYLEVRVPSGRPVFVTATAPRDGAGFAWASPDSGIRLGHRVRRPN